MSHEDRVYDRHPSYGTVQFSRVTGGGGQFFGSSVKTHNYIDLMINTAVRYHDFGHDTIQDEANIIRVSLTPGQFAELLTTMNVGSGIPCTIIRRDGKSVERLPEQASEASRSREHFEKTISGRADEFRKARDELTTLFKEKKNISQQDRARVVSVLDSMVCQFTSNMPFYYEQFQEAVDRTVVEAKAEVEAFVTHAVYSTGLQTLRDNAPQLTNES